MIDARSIRYVDDGQVARITLNRPPLNIMTLETLDDLDAAIAHAAAVPALKVLVIAATGRAFSAGVAVEDHLGDRVGPTLDAFHSVFRRLHAVECVTIAAVQGAALGGGAELATFCDVVVASDAAAFGQPEIKVGVFPPSASGSSIAWRVPRRSATPWRPRSAGTARSAPWCSGSPSVPCANRMVCRSTKG